MVSKPKDDNPPNFRSLPDQMKAEINRLIRERREIDRKILSLKHSLRGIEGYLDAQLDQLRLDPVPLEPQWTGLREMGLTDAVRKVIENSIESVNAKGIRKQLEVLSYPKLPKDNPLAPIHAILTRLEKNKEIRRVKGVDGKPAYESAKQITDLVEEYEKAHPEEVPDRWRK